MRVADIAKVTRNFYHNSIVHPAYTQRTVVDNFIINLLKR